VPKGWSLVGADMEGLELRGLAHYLAKFDDGAYGDIVLNGDPHWANAVAMGLVAGDRDKASQLHTVAREAGSKRFIYAYIYGCGDMKAGEIIFDCLLNARNNCGPEGAALYRQFFGDNKAPGENLLRKVGKKVRNDFASKIGGFVQLKTRIGKVLDTKGYLPGLDGRRIGCRSEHSALNFLIQSAGAILCKRWIVDATEEMHQHYGIGWDKEVTPILWVHDELQVAVRTGLEAEVGSLIVKHAQKAGEPYGFRVRLDSKYTSGRDWSETH
jgi:DNA polymerase I